MMLARDREGYLLEPAPGAKALCPACRGEVIAKCGDIVTPHWAHRAADCDPWAEPESEWHRSWKLPAPPARREVVMGPHRADLVAPNGVVVEIQHSNISGDSIREREAFYQRMLWIFDARKGADRIFLDGAKRLCPKCLGTLWVPVGRGSRARCLCREGAVASADRDDVYAVWVRARRDWTLCTAPVLLDLGDDLLRVTGHLRGPGTRFFSRRIQRSNVVSWIAGVPVGVEGP